jgi:hypothetical protein
MVLSGAVRCRLVGPRFTDVTGRCDELALIKEVVGRKTASLEVNGLA